MFKSSTALALAIAMTTPFAIAQDESQTRESSITVTNALGNETTINRNLTAENGTVDASVSVQSETGRGGEKSLTRTIDDETGVVSRETQVSNNAGASASNSITIDTEENTISRVDSRTRENGGTVTLERSREATGTGGVASATITGPDGSVTRETGRSYTSEGGFQRSTSITGPDGRSTSSETRAQCGPDGCSRERTQTGADGRTRSVTDSVSRGENGRREREREVTRPNGETKKRERKDRRTS